MRHDNNLFYNLFEDVWDFNNLFDGAMNGDDSFLEPIDNLKLSFDLVSDISLEDEVVLLNDFVLVDDDFLYFSDVLFNGNNLFFDQWNLNDFLLDDWDFYDLLLDGLYHLVDLDDNWVVYQKLNNLRDLDDLLVQFLDFIHSWDFVGDCDDLFNNVWHLNDLLNC